jgi:hypothetical protein
MLSVLGAPLYVAICFESSMNDAIVHWCVLTDDYLVMALSLLETLLTLHSSLGREAERNHGRQAKEERV